MLRSRRANKIQPKHLDLTYPSSGNFPFMGRFRTEKKGAFTRVNSPPFPQALAASALPSVLQNRPHVCRPGRRGGCHLSCLQNLRHHLRTSHTSALGLAVHPLAESGRDGHTQSLIGVSGLLPSTPLYFFSHKPMLWVFLPDAPSRNESGPNTVHIAVCIMLLT